MMNLISRLTIASLFIANAVNAESDGWGAQSTESQHGKSSVLIAKDSEAKKAPLTQSMSKSLSTKLSKSSMLHKQGAISLQQRPVLNDLTHAFWIYDASVTLRNDIDYDGYSYRFSLEFDADTVFAEAEVYARLYLAKEDVFKEYHSTSVFTIMGENTEDSLIVDSELLNGFPSGDYEILIELYDAYSDELVAILDSYDDPDLYLLTLESKDYEYVEPVVVEGGSMGYLSLLLVPLLIYRVKSHRKVNNSANLPKMIH